MNLRLLRPCLYIFVFVWKHNFFFTNWPSVYLYLWKVVTTNAPLQKRPSKQRFLKCCFCVDTWKQNFPKMITFMKTLLTQLPHLSPYSNRLLLLEFKLIKPLSVSVYNEFLLRFSNMQYVVHILFCYAWLLISTIYSVVSLCKLTSFFWAIQRIKVNWPYFTFWYIKLESVGTSFEFLSASFYFSAVIYQCWKLLDLREKRLVSVSLSLPFLSYITQR